MCCGGKCLFFIPIRTGSLIFGYFIAVISASGTIACICANLYFIIELMFPQSYSDNYRNSVCATIIIITVFLAEFLSSFICSVLLLAGINKKKAGLLKAFIIYGMLQVFLLFIFFIILHCTKNFFSAGLLFLALAFLGGYSLCLYMVFLVHQLMDDGLVFVNPPSEFVHLFTGRQDM